MAMISATEPSEFRMFPLVSVSPASKAEEGKTGKTRTYDISIAENR
jgi:hypothetical protein